MNFDLLLANRESRIENEATRKEYKEKAASSFIAGQQAFLFFGECKNETKMNDAKESKVACLVVSLGQGRQQQKPQQQQHKMESTKSAGARQEKEATTIKRKLAPKKKRKLQTALEPCRVEYL